MNDKIRFLLSDTMLENYEYRKENACHWLLIERNQASHMTGVFCFTLGGIGGLLNKQKSGRKWLKEAQTEPIAFCDSRGPRLPLGIRKMDRSEHF